MNVVYPISSKDAYTQNDIVDFLLTFEGREIAQPSIRVSGLVKVSKSAAFDTTQLLDTSDAQFDSTAGIAGAFQGITCSCDNLGIIENQIERGRYVKAKAAATVSPQQLLTDCRNTTELKSGNDTWSRRALGSSQGSIENTC